MGGKTGKRRKRREEEQAIAKRKECLKEQNRKVKRKAPESPISEKVDVTYLDGYTQRSQEKSQEDVKESSSTCTLEAPTAPQEPAQPTTKSDHRGDAYHNIESAAA